MMESDLNELGLKIKIRVYRTKETDWSYDDSMLKQPILVRKWNC